MGEKEKVETKRMIVVELKVLMHCQGCENQVSKVLSKFKGVESFTTKMDKHRVVVTGRIDPQKVVKKLKKKTGKKVEIVFEKYEETNCHGSHFQFRPEICYCCCIKNEDLMMFSDENPNACVLM